MKQISFGEFFNSVKDRLTDSQLRDLNGQDWCYVSRGTYLSISYDTNMDELWIDWAVGHGLDWIRELKSACLKTNIKLVGFRTKTDNEVVQKLAKYMKADLIDEKNGFFFYRLDMQNVR